MPFYDTYKLRIPGKGFQRLVKINTVTKPKPVKPGFFNPDEYDNYLFTNKKQIKMSETKQIQSGNTFKCKKNIKLELHPKRQCFTKDKLYNIQINDVKMIGRPEDEFWFVDDEGDKHWVDEKYLKENFEKQD